MASESYRILKESTESRFQCIATQLQNPIDTVISFSGICKDYCVCIVDVVSSTKITASLTPAKACVYYSIFLNSIALIAKEFGASIVKNVGDSLLYYFPQTSEISNSLAFNDAIECGLQMIKSRHIVNKKMLDAGLQPISFRISCDYGAVMKAKSESSTVDDIFGPTVNMCAKINSKTTPNTISIGSDMYQVVKSLPTYKFKQIAEYSVGFKQSYPIYGVTEDGYT